MIRRFYEVAVRRDAIKQNPARFVYAAKDPDRGINTIKTLTAGHMEFMFHLLPKEETEELLRAKLILALMGIQGLRTVEVYRASEEDYDRVTASF